MLFDMTASTNGRKLMVLNTKFPKDASVSVVKGQSTSATFEVRIAEHGRPPEYTYQWYVDGKAVDGATSETFTKDGLTKTAEHTVYCEVSNKKGTVVSRTATLKVEQLIKPVLDSNYPADATAEINKQITCKAVIKTAGTPDKYTYQWFKNGTAVSGATGSSYTFTPNELGTSEIYCEVTSSAGTVTTRKASIKTIMHIYKSGSGYVSVTGGWSDDGYSYETPGDAAGGTSQSDHLQAKFGDGYNGCMGTNNAIDLTKCKTLFVNGITTNAYASSCVYVTTKKSPILNGVAAKKYLPETRGVISLDVSKITGKHFVCFGAAFSVAATSKVYEMWFE